MNNYKNEKSIILLYNFNNDDRTTQIRRFFTKKKIKVKTIQSPDFLQPVGYLCEIPQFSKLSVFNLGNNFSDEMIVMYRLSDELLDEFLQFFKDNSIKPVDLKAVVTIINQNWNSVQLHNALITERKK